MAASADTVEIIARLDSLQSDIDSIKSVIEMVGALVDGLSSNPMAKMMLQGL